MFRGAVYHPPTPDDRRGWAVIIAVVFAVIAAISFAVDVTISVSASAPKPPALHLGPTVR